MSAEADEVRCLVWMRMFENKQRLYEYEFGCCDSCTKKRCPFLIPEWTSYILSASSILSYRGGRALSVVRNDLSTCME